MATIYFTTNADSGDGSFRAALASAASGDTISPDPDVFAEGSTITIPLASVVLFDDDRTLTISGEGRRICFDGQEAKICSKLGDSSTNYLHFYDVNFIRGYGSSYGTCFYVYSGANATAIFGRCLFAGAKRSGTSNPSPLINTTANTTLSFADSIIVATATSAMYLSGGSSVNIVRCTIIGGFAGSLSNSYVSDIILFATGDASIATTFVNAPTESPIVYSSDWDFRLLSTSSYKTGGSSTGTDFDGRTRLANGCLGAVANIRRLTSTTNIDVWATDTPYIDQDDVVIGTLNLAAPLSVDKSFKVGTLNLSAALTFPSTASDRVLAVTEAATFTSASASGYGYLAIPHGTATTGLTAGSNVVVCDYGAGVSALSAINIAGTTTVTITRSASNPVCLEKEVDDEWTLVNAQYDSATYADSAGVVGEKYRVFDGVSFTEATAEAVSVRHRLTSTTGTIDVLSYEEPYIDQDDVVIGTLNLAAPLSVDKSFKVGTLNLSAALTFPSTASDRVLAVTEAATFTSASASGYGYLALPHGTATTGLTAGSNVVVCDYGAGVSAFIAVAKNGSNELFFEKSDSSAQVVVEKGENNVWTILDDDCSTSVYSDDDGELNDVYRIFDGETFKTATAGYWVHGFVTNASIATTITVVNSSIATAITVSEKYLLMSDSKRLGETPICFARVENSETETPLKQADISSITYTVYKYDYASIRAGGSGKTAVSGWSGLTVDKTTAIKDTPVSNDPRCSFAYNFVFEPVTVASTPFTATGNYTIEFTITPTTGNKVPVVFDFSLS